MLKIIPISALKDNYIWLISNPKSASCIVVDPGEAHPIQKILKESGWKLEAILLTHHHGDHTGGVEELIRDRSDCRVFAPAEESIPETTNPLSGGDTIHIDETGGVFEVLSIPGHTRGHIAYYGHNAVFCGDTLFTGGCGRVFEGTIPQMYNSLLQLKNLPDQTKIYCGHEYTEANLRFASMVELQNTVLDHRIRETQLLRANNLPTVPGILAVEKQTNPFLRCDVNGIKQAAEQYCRSVLNTEAEVFNVLREWKNKAG